MLPSSRRIGFFISPHGFGHASRACAVMNAVGELDSGICFQVFTSVPDWFFKQSLTVPYELTYCRSDIGLVQNGPLRVDLSQTLVNLQDFFESFERDASRFAGELRTRGCELVISDVSPLGISAANCAELPSVLIENFTWNWIYEGYYEEAPDLGRFIELNRELVDSCDYRIQAEPVCERSPKANLIVAPISRHPRMNRKDTRARLGIGDSQTVILITMGGIATEHGFLEQLSKVQSARFIVPGASSQTSTEGNLSLLPASSDFFHPDLVGASDVVVSKLGYSTVAEVYNAGVGFAFVERPGFRESEVLSDFALEKMNASSIGAIEFESGEWIKELPRYLHSQPEVRQRQNGDTTAAQFITEII
jgi:hypothetical protein